MPGSAGSPGGAVPREAAAMTIPLRAIRDPLLVVLSLAAIWQVLH